VRALLTCYQDTKSFLKTTLPAFHSQLTFMDIIVESSSVLNALAQHLVTALLDSSLASFFVGDLTLRICLLTHRRSNIEGYGFIYRGNR
jgi:hypothetical protein